MLRVQERAERARVQVPGVEDGRRDGRRRAILVACRRREHGEGGFAGQGPGREHDGRRGSHLPRGPSPRPWQPAAQTTQATPHRPHPGQEEAQEG